MSNVWKALMDQLETIPFSATEKKDVADRWKQYLSDYAEANNPVSGQEASMQTLLFQLQKRYQEEGVGVLFKTLSYMLTPKKYSVDDLNSFLSAQGIEYSYIINDNELYTGKFIAKKMLDERSPSVCDCSNGTTDCRHAQMELEQEVLESHKKFWAEYGKDFIDQYKPRLRAPAGNPLNADELNDKLGNCKVLLLTANSVEGAIVSQCLIKSCGKQKLDRITADKLTYQFASIQGKPVVHIWPQGTSSFTIHGSFLALKSALKRFCPSVVFSLGVAFGASPSAQAFGDVLVSERLVFYDAFNKITDGTLKLSADEVQMVGEDILAGCQFLKPDLCSDEQFPFHFHLGTLLTGGTVLSDTYEKQRLFRAVEALGQTAIGGEMEGSGVYFACNSLADPVPFLIVKGICDWGVKKNGWEIVTSDVKMQQSIKNCIQAYAAENAFKTVDYIISQISI